MESISPPQFWRRFGAKAVAALLAALAVSVSAPIPADAEDRPLRVGVDRSYPPFQFADERGRPQGFDVDLFEAVAKQVGLRYELVVGDWPAIRAGLEAGEFEVGLGVIRTPVREPLLGFSVPTAWVHHTLFVRDETSIESAADLGGRRVLVASSGPHDDLLRESIPGIELVLAKTSEDALRRLAAGEGRGGDLARHTRALGDPRGQDLRCALARRAAR